MKFLASVLALFAFAPPAGAMDLVARHCEVFVDKVGVLRSSHGASALRLYVKSRGSALDGAIVRVGFHGVRKAEGGSPGSASPGDFVTRELGRFMGADDYFELKLDLSGDYAFPCSYEGSFFVQTDRGTRYWANTAEGRDFVLDRGMRDDLERLTSSTYSDRADLAVPTADRFTYLNPGRCR